MGTKAPHSPWAGETFPALFLTNRHTFRAATEVFIIMTSFTGNTEGVREF